MIPKFLANPGLASITNMIGKLGSSLFHVGSNVFKQAA